MNNRYKSKFSRISKRSKFKEFILCTLDWLVTFFPKVYIPLEPVHTLAEKLFTILETRGIEETIRYSKSMRSNLFNAVSKLPALAEVRKLPRKELPKSILWLRKVDESLVYPYIRLILTTCYLTRTLRLPEDLKTDTITDGPISRYPSDIGRFSRDFWKDLGHKHVNACVPSRVSFSQFHLTTKRGPNGHALWTSIVDFLSLPDSLIESIKVVGGRKLTKRINYMNKYKELLPISLFQLPKVLSFRKITAIPDVEGKSRVVAILDYWSQTSLRPLHHYLFRCLKQINQDCTFDQGSFISKLPNNGEIYYSVDLSAATDRFPIQLIEEVLLPKFGETFVKEWRNIMVGYSFDTKEGPISYQVGNPMGAYSSWNSFALAHHYVIYYCCRILKLKWRDAPYVMLGDDICIKHESLAKLYIKTMEDLGVKISYEKSHVSPYAYEFAKRFVHNNQEITPFPINALHEFRNNPVLGLNLLISEERKGWSHPIGTTLESLILLLEKRKFSSSYRSRKRLELYPIHQFMMVLQGKQTAHEALSPLVRLLSPKVVHDAMEVAHIERTDNCPYMGLLRSSIMQLFVESGEYNSEDKPLGLIAMELVIFITSLELKDSDTHQDIIECIPHLQVHGEIENTYLRIQREAWDIDTIYGGDWKLSLRAITIPISDEIYFDRNKELKIHASGKLAKVFTSNLEQLAAFPQMI